MAAARPTCANSIMGYSTARANPVCGNMGVGSGLQNGRVVWNGPDAHGCGLDNVVTVGNPNFGAQTGSPPYLPLGAGSSAIGKGASTYCAAVPVDQKGDKRPATNCDAGAVQRIVAPRRAGETADGGGGGVYSPPVTPTPIACTGELLNNSGYRVQTTYGLCAGVQFQRVHGSGHRHSVDRRLAASSTRSTYGLGRSRRSKSASRRRARRSSSTPPPPRARLSRWLPSAMETSPAPASAAPAPSSSWRPIQRMDRFPPTVRRVPLVMPAPAPAAPAPEPTAIPIDALGQLHGAHKSDPQPAELARRGNHRSRALGSLADRFRVFERVVLHRFSRRARLDQRRLR